MKVGVVVYLFYFYRVCKRVGVRVGSWSVEWGMGVLSFI